MLDTAYSIRAAAGWLSLALVASACAQKTTDVDRAGASPSVSEAPLLAVEAPAGPGAMAPNLGVDGAGVLLTWLERGGDREVRLGAARWNGEGWGEALEVVSGEAFFANWADLPAAAGGADGTLFAHWLEKLGEDTYAYGVQLARSADAGATWERIGLLHDDASPTEHGFVSYVPLAEGVQAFWLDGRGMVGDPPGPMQLLTATLADGGPGPGTVLDERVCECCSTDAALTAEGPIVVYRDRGEAEIRDVSVIRAEGGAWSAPATLADDGWQIHGCPVNGPSVAASGHRVAVAWFTAALGEPRVKVAFSDDAGRTFGAPLVVDAEAPLGRVDVTMDAAGRAWILWLGTAGEAGKLKLQPFTAEGRAAPMEIVAETTVKRSAGLPRIAFSQGRLVLAWVEDAEPSKLATAVRPVG